MAKDVPGRAWHGQASVRRRSDADGLAAGQESGLAERGCRRFLLAGGGGEGRLIRPAARERISRVGNAEGNIGLTVSENGLVRRSHRPRTSCRDRGAETWPSASPATLPSTKISPTRSGVWARTRSANSKDGLADAQAELLEELGRTAARGWGGVMTAHGALAGIPV